MGEFTTDGNLPNQLTWDIIPMDAGSLTVQPTVTTRTACQALCSGDDRCQYFAWYDYNVTAGSQTQCFTRRAAAAVAPIAGFAPTTSTNAVLFEVKEGLYAVYAATDAATIGTTISTGLPWSTAKPACDGNPACVGLAVGSGANSWRLFGAADWEGATGKVKVVGPTLNSWVAEPTP